MSKTQSGWTLGRSQLKRNGEVEIPVLEGEYRIFTISFRADQPTAGHANARLIAAAPELLEAVKIACEFFDQHGFPHAGQKQVETVRAALRKAEGREVPR